MASTNQRQAKRTPVTLKIKFKSETINQFIERYSVDISQGGIFIRTKDPLAVGTKLRFEFQLKDASPLITGDGTVVWTRDQASASPGAAPGMGVRFDRLPGDSQEVLRTILAQKNPRPATVQTTKGKSAQKPAATRDSFNDSPTRVAPSGLVEGLTGDSGPKRTMMGMGPLKSLDEVDKTPLPAPMPFHTDAGDFPEETFEEATKVAQYDKLVDAAAKEAAGGGEEAEEEDDAGAAADASGDVAAAEAKEEADEGAEPAQAAEDDGGDETDEAEEAASRDEAESAPEEEEEEEEERDEEGIASGGGEEERSEADAAEGDAEEAAGAADAAADADGQDAAREQSAEDEDGADAEDAASPSEEDADEDSDADAVAAKRPPAAAAASAGAAAAADDRRGGGAWVAIGAAILLIAGVSVYYVVTKNRGAKASPAHGPAVAMAPADATAPAAPKPGTAAPKQLAPTPVAPETASVVVKSVPPGANAEVVGGTQSGTTPATLAGLAPGKDYQVRVSDPKYVTRTVTVHAGQKEPATVVLKPKPRVLRITSQPPGATVYVNGKRRKVTPVDVPLTGALAKAHAYAVVLRRRGYRRVRRKVPSSVTFQPDGDDLVYAVTVNLPQRHRQHTSHKQAHPGTGGGQQSGASGSAGAGGGKTSAGAKATKGAGGATTAVKTSGGTTSGASKATKAGAKSGKTSAKSGKNKTKKKTTNQSGPKPSWMK